MQSVLCTLCHFIVMLFICYLVTQVSLVFHAVSSLIYCVLHTVTNRLKSTDIHQVQPIVLPHYVDPDKDKLLLIPS